MKHQGQQKYPNSQDVMTMMLFT